MEAHPSRTELSPVPVTAAPFPSAFPLPFLSLPAAPFPDMCRKKGGAVRGGRGGTGGTGSPRAQWIQSPSQTSGQAWHPPRFLQIPPDSVQSMEHFTLFMHTSCIYLNKHWEQQFQGSTVEAENCEGPSPVPLFATIQLALPFLLAFMKTKCKWVRKTPVLVSGQGIWEPRTRIWQ